MGKRQNAWGLRKTLELRAELGNICNWMSCTKTEDLQFDCIQAMGHKHHRCSRSERATFYRRQHALGNLQLLCPKHHILKSKTEHPSYKPKALEDLQTPTPEIDVPF